MPPPEIAGSEWSSTTFGPDMSRRRILRILAVAIVLIVSVAAVWVWQSGREERTASPVLTLRVNRAQQVTVGRGTPLVFDAYLTATRTGRAIRIGSGSRPWHRLIRLEQGDAGEALSWDVTEVVARSTRYSRDAAGGPTITTEPGDVAELDALNYVHTLTLGVAPDTSTSIAAGTYQVRAVVDPPFWPPWRWRHRVTSAPVTITVQEANAPATGSSSDDAELRRLTESAAFYLRVKRFADAQRVASELLKVQPRSAGAYIQLGEALEGLGHDVEALQAYSYALPLLPATYEEPRDLLERISRLMRKTGRMF